MCKYGFIGFGSMGAMYVKGLVNSGLVAEEQIIVTRNDKSRLGEIKQEWPGIHTAVDAAEVAVKAEYIFICVKPLEYSVILREIKPAVHPDKHIISFAGTVPIACIESAADCKITKVMPTLVSEVREGITLVCHNHKVTAVDASFIESLIGYFGCIKNISEKDFGFASELTSCGPGLMATVFREFAEAGLRHTESLVREEIQEMVLQTLYGTAKLMLDKEISFDDVISRVATKGGITEEGVKVIKQGLPQVFDDLFDRTMEKRRLVGEKVEQGFCKML